MNVSNELVERIAHAIATAEGFFALGSRPQRNHNPGDFERDIIHKGVGFDGAYVVYATDADGWRALYKQVRLMFDGSAIYRPDMTILQVAMKYTATQQVIWARNVAHALGVTINTKLSDIQSGV